MLFPLLLLSPFHLQKGQASCLACLHCGLGLGNEKHDLVRSESRQRRTECPQPQQPVGASEARSGVRDQTARSLSCVHGSTVAGSCVYLYCFAAVGGDRPPVEKGVCVGGRASTMGN